MAEITCLKCGKVCKSLQGWKGHMSGTHGGYDESDLQAAAGIGEGGDARSRMDNFVATMPSGEASGAAAEGGTPSAAGTSSPPAPDNTRRVRATPKKLKKVLGGIPAEILKTTGIELDKDDIETLDEAGEFLGDIFGFEFAVPEAKVAVESRLWAVVWVIGVGLLVYVKHKFPQVFAYALKAFKQKDGEVEETETAGAKVRD